MYKSYIKQLFLSLKLEVHAVDMLTRQVLETKGKEVKLLFIFAANIKRHLLVFQAEVFNSKQHK